MSLFINNKTKSVYCPSDDSFLLCDAILKDCNDKIRPFLCVEIGSGTGICTSQLIETLSNSKETIFVTTDINKFANDLTKSNLSKKWPQKTIETINCDLFKAPKRLWGRVDILIFNPPYVATPKNEISKYCRNEDECVRASYAGGVNGMEIICRVLEDVSNGLLSPNGIFYLLISHFNKKMDKVIAEKNLRFETIATKSVLGEKLRVVKIF